MKDKEYYLSQTGDNRFYVYIHSKATDGSPFYVGKGQGKRAWRTDRVNPFWQNIRKKHGVIVDIIFDDLDEDTAFQCEKDIILELKYFGCTLSNMTDGGDGPSGYVYSEETRKQMSESQKTSPKVKAAREQAVSKRRGVKRGPQPKISKALKGKPKTAEHIEAVASARRCKTIYEFIFFETGEIFTGTRFEFREKYQLKHYIVSGLFGSRPNITAAGWVLVGEYFVDNPHIERFLLAIERGKSSKRPSEDVKKRMSESHLAFRARQREEREQKCSEVEEL